MIIIKAIFTTLPFSKINLFAITHLIPLVPFWANCNEERINLFLFNYQIKQEHLLYKIMGKKAEKN